MKKGFLDGCHKYGWAITIITNLVFFAYFGGRMIQKLSDVEDRVGRLELQWEKYLHEVRGIK